MSLALYICQQTFQIDLSYNFLCIICQLLEEFEPISQSVLCKSLKSFSTSSIHAELSEDSKLIFRIYAREAFLNLPQIVIYILIALIDQQLVMHHKRFHCLHMA